jgi:hypothetical protein
MTKSPKVLANIYPLCACMIPRGFCIKSHICLGYGLEPHYCKPKAGSDDIMGQWPFLDFNGPRPNYSSVNLPLRFAIGIHVWSSPPIESQLAHLRANNNSWADLVAPSSVHIPIASSVVTTKSKKVKYPFMFSFHNSR